LSSNRVLDVYVSGGGIYTGLRDGGVGILPNVAMDIPNATSATYTFSPTAAAADGTYPVVVSHANGCSITSEAVSLTINNPPTITTPPIDQAVCPGDEATFSVAASGSGTLRYQWQQTCQATEWTVYNMSNSNFPRNSVQDVYESGGVIYAATFSGGVATLDVAAGATTWTVYNTGNSNLPNNNCFGVYESDGVIYAATSGGDVATLDVGAGATIWTVYNTSNSNFPYAAVLGVYESGGVIYAATSGGGVATLDVGAGAMIWTVYNTSNSNLPHDDVTGVYESGGVIYAATGGGVATLAVGAGATTWTVYDTSNSNLPSNGVSSVYESGGVIYAATYGSGLATLDVGAGAMTWMVYNTSNSNLPQNTVTGVYESDGVIYAATFGGVATLDVGASAMIWTVYNKSNSNLPNNNISSVYESDGVIYAATEGGGVATLDLGGMDIPNATSATYTFSLTAAAADCTYQVVVSDASGCRVTSEAVSLTIEESCIVPVEVVLEDPCSCLNNASTIDLDAGAGGADGQFAELVTLRGVGGATLASNLDYRVVSMVGGADADNIPAVGTQSDGTAIAPGTAFTFNATTSFYELAFVHVDEVGYTLIVQQYIDDVAAGDQYMIANNCAYPNPTFDPVLVDLYCPDAPAFLLGAMPAGADGVTYTIDGNAATQVDPPNLSIGFHTVLMTYDAAAGANGGISPDGGTTPALPGCVQTVQKVIEVNDTEPPMITCPVDVTIECDEDSSPANTGTATATDNCNTAPVITFTDMVAPGTCPQESTITRTWTATDGVNLMATCVQTITIVDTQAPTIACPADLTLQCVSGQDTSPATTGTASATDACDPNPVITFADNVVPGNCAGNYVIERTWTATDECGTAATCLQVIRVEDTTPPVIACPADLTLQCVSGQDTSPATTGTASATDACDPNPVITFADNVVPGNCAGNYVIERTWTATDECGTAATCLQVIRVEDTTPPVIACPADLTLQCVSGQDTSPATTGTASATDACDPNPVITFADNVVPGNCAGNYVIERTWTATDECGTAATCLQVIRVEDTTPPVIACPADLTLQCVSGQDTSPATTGTASATDACDPNPVITFADNVVPGNCAGNYVIERTWTATDECGNPSTCVQTITIQDTQAPTVTCTDFTDTFEGCPDAIGLNTPDGVWTAVGADGGFTAAAGGTYTITGDLTACVSDNCAALADLEYTLFSSREENRTACAVTVVNEFSIRDACGNVAAEQVVTRHTIEDTTPPMITCPADVTTECDEDDSPANTGMATTPSTCNPTPTISYMDVLSPLADGYLITRSWTATDACGNSSSCEQLITVASCEPQLMDPCSCINNATIFDLDTGLGGDDGQFSELVAVTGPNGAPILANSLITWQVFSSSGGVDAFAATPLAPAQTAGNPIPVGTELFYNPATGHYELPFYHYDGVGYSLSVQQFVNGMPGQILGPISNNCVYPNPVFDPVFQDLYCPDEPAFTLGGVDNNGLGFDVVSFTIDGNAATQLDPSALSVGFHTVLMTWDGAAGTNNGSGTMANPNEPGCEQSVQKGNYSGCLKGYFAKKSYFLG
jgi:hypothetical protein